ncbi:MAG: SOUL heme-binding protein [Methanoregula sp. PtaU1.Bin051]|nr:MAG: SOUL heme-binding protein [Methanoregula sp. PtaU1.Bin051]
MRPVLLLITAIAVLLILVLLLVLSSAESVPYTVRMNAGEIEIRHYPALVIATVDSDSDESGFNMLLSYISGNNAVRSKIPMTAPVITSQKIPMTAPVISDANMMAFVLPAGMSREETPDPLDPRVRIETIPERDVAVIRFAGYAQKQEADAATARLIQGLEQAGIKTAGSAFLMRYDAPWTPGFLRRNEVGIEVRRP